MPECGLWYGRDCIKRRALTIGRPQASCFAYRFQSRLSMTEPHDPVHGEGEAQAFLSECAPRSALRCLNPMQSLFIMQMRLSQIWFLFPLTIGHATLAFTSHDLPPSKATLINVSRAAGLRNQTLDIPIQPASFSVTYEIGGPKLRTTACLMNAVHALKILALGDWYANIVDGTEYQSVSYREVSISVNTQKRNRSIQARYVVWAIMLGIHHMILENKFELAQFEMKLDGKLLGWVHVANNPPPPRLTVAGGHANRTVGVAKRSAAPLS